MIDRPFVNSWDDRANSGNVYEVVTYGREMTEQELELAVRVFLASYPPARRARNRRFKWDQVVWPGER